MNKICIWSKCRTRENWQKFTFKIRIWNLNERHVRDTFFFSTARIPFFLTPLCHSSFTAEILYPLFLPYSLFIIGISFSMSEQLFSFFFKFPSPPSSFTNSFHPLNFSFSFVLFSTAFSTKFLFFRIFRFPSLRIRISLLSSLNFLPRVKGKIKKKNPYDYTYFRKYPIPKFIAIKLIPEEKLSRETTDRLLIRYSWYPTPKWNWKP